jgi:hypothetical protein
MQKIRIIELLFENRLHLADWIPTVTIYSRYLRQNVSAQQQERIRRSRVTAPLILNRDIRCKSEFRQF